jgi:hypothetical protein
MKPVMITRKEEALIFQKHAAGSGVWVNCPYRINAVPTLIEQV